MGTGARAFIVIGVVGLVLVSPGRASADETDNFTCRNRFLRDSLGALDALMNARIRDVVERANRLDTAACDASCLFRELLDGIGANYRHPLTEYRIPDSRSGSLSVRTSTGVILRSRNLSTAPVPTTSRGSFPSTAGLSSWPIPSSWPAVSSGPTSSTTSFEKGSRTGETWNGRAARLRP